MSKKIWQSIGVCLLAGFLTVQAQAEGKSGKNKAEADVKSAVEAINSGKFKVISAEQTDKEGWYNVVMLLPNGKKVSVSLSGNSSIVTGYLEENEGSDQDDESSPSDPVEVVEDPITVPDDPFANS